MAQVAKRGRGVVHVRMLIIMYPGYFTASILDQVVPLCLLNLTARS
jgi:hypothetical protein